MCAAACMLPAMLRPSGPRAADTSSADAAAQQARLKHVSSTTRNRVYYSAGSHVFSFLVKADKIPCLRYMRLKGGKEIMFEDT